MGKKKSKIGLIIISAHNNGYTISADSKDGDQLMDDICVSKLQVMLKLQSLLNCDYIKIKEAEVDHTSDK